MYFNLWLDMSAWRQNNQMLEYICRVTINGLLMQSNNSNSRNTIAFRDVIFWNETTQSSSNKTKIVHFYLYGYILVKLSTKWRKTMCIYGNELDSRFRDLQIVHLNEYPVG